jgi:L-alanine-DL-glutamate epimerase-like enolase superfamily enzyme
VSLTAAAMEVTGFTLPLGPARGGSGATEVQVARVRLRDGEGADGTGFTYALTGGMSGAVRLLEAELAEVVIGSDLAFWPRTWQRISQRGSRMGRGSVMPALSALDIAVWDLRARRAGEPLYRLFGAYRDSVQVYGSGRATHAMSVDELVAGAQAYLDEGYRAVKLRVGARPPAEDLARVRTVREAIGDEPTVMVDCNERLDFPSALWLGSRLHELGVLWLEEPLVASDVAGHARLASQLPVAIAAGEHLQGRSAFAAYIERRAASVLMPDAPLVGGVTEWLRVAELAGAANLTVSPHFLPELHIHLAAAAETCLWVEHFPLIDDVLARSLTVCEGRMRPPEAPGHGMVWDEERIDALRWR